MAAGALIAKAVTKATPALASRALPLACRAGKRSPPGERATRRGLHGLACLVNRKAHGCAPPHPALELQDRPDRTRRSLSPALDLIVTDS